jgi:hypothetical protein
LYKRVIRLTTKFKAHDELNDAHTGDTVMIEESRPLSATKRWRLIEVVARAGTHGSTSEIVADEEATTEAIHSAAHPGRTHDDDSTGSDGGDAHGGDAPTTDDAEAVTADSTEGGPA